MNENRFILRLHIALLVIVLLGFARSFYLRDLFLSRPLDSALRIHGALLTSWFALTVLQSYLIALGRRHSHRQVAWIAGLVALGVVLSSAWINTRLAITLRSAAEPENIFVWGNYLTLVAFIALFVAGIRSRRDPQGHRRLILLASIAITGPAFARFAFWPVMGYGLGVAPIFSIAGLIALLALVVGYDLLNLRKVHSATAKGLAAIVICIALGVGIGASGLGFQVLSWFGLTVLPNAASSPLP